MAKNLKVGDRVRYYNYWLDKTKSWITVDGTVTGIEENGSVWIQPDLSPSIIEKLILHRTNLIRLRPKKKEKSVRITRQKLALAWDKNVATWSVPEESVRSNVFRRICYELGLDE